MALSNQIESEGHTSRADVPLPSIIKGQEGYAAAQARERGVSLDAYVQEIVSQQVHSAALGAADGRSLKLPVLHLGDMGSLRRCDIYDDVD